LLFNVSRYVCYMVELIAQFVFVLTYSYSVNEKFAAAYWLTVNKHEVQFCIVLCVNYCKTLNFGV